MSSATSTSADVRLKPDPTDAEVRSQSGGTGSGSAGVQAAPAAFRPVHFFVLASLIAATGAVIMARQSAPEHLILISITIASAGLAAAGFYRTLSPLVGDATVPTGESLSARTRAVLEREKALSIRSLKDLEFDRSMGKVSQADFDEMAGRLRGRALLLMKQLEEDGAYRTVIERELSARLAARAAGAVDEPAPRPALSREPAIGLCSCGTANDADAQFCKRCGTKLVRPTVATSTTR
jgi:hypothetical protein